MRILRQSHVRARMQIHVTVIRYRRWRRDDMVAAIEYAFEELQR